MKNYKIALFLGVIAIIAGAALVPYQLEALQITLSGSDYAKAIADLPVSLPVMMIGAGFQIGIMSFVLSWIGLTLAKRTTLSVPLLKAWLLDKRKPVIDRSGIKIALIGGALGAVFMVLIDVFLFQPHIPKVGNGEAVTVWKALLGGLLYGGVVEEILVRLFLMTLFVWIFSIITKKTGDAIPNVVYWVALTLAALLFSAGHLPATEAIFHGLTPLLIIRAFVLNGILGLLFGYLYWKKGLEYAMVSHMTVHIVTQLILLPLLNLI